ncbi:MAG: GGDEF domain-containing protein [Thioalkalispiraceae bacterium]|jgi:diguanylate cyclase (GGDEF)-like protein
MNRVKRYADKLALFMIDIDHFKQVNDTYGHDVGDKILQQVSRLLEENVRSIDQLCRWGGEEFIALIPFKLIYLIGSINDPFVCYAVLTEEGIIACGYIQVVS